MGRETALITGASSGIGYELAKVFAKNGYNVVLVARNVTKLNEVAKQLEQNHSVTATVIPADLTEQTAPARIFERTRDLALHIDVLVNNAGFGNFGHLTETDLNRELELIQVNMAAVAHLTKLFLPEMVKRQHGRILNVASTAAFQPGPMMANYFASKAYVLSLSEALSYELRDTGVTVTALCPGATQTRFQQAADMDGSNLFRGKVMDAEIVARYGYAACLSGKMIAIPGTKNKLGAFFVRLVPRKLVLRVAERLVAVSH